MNSTSKSKGYVLGMSIGTFWLIASSAGFSIQMIVSAGTRDTRAVLIAVVLLAATLLAVPVRQIVAAAKLPAEPPRADPRRIRRRFVWIVILEVVGIVVMNGVLYSRGHLSLLVPVDLILIGVHFFPLAKLFGVPRYTLLGTSFCAIPVLTVLLVPADVHIGAALARFLIPSLGCTVAAWLTSVGNMFEVQGLLAQTTRTS